MDKNMITEDHVSFEIAKLLKEKGFDECPLYCYDDCGLIWMMGGYDKTIEWHFPAPTLQMAMKWLRKEHNLHCTVDYDFALGWYCQITSLKETVEYDYEEMKHYHPDYNNGFSSPEEAAETAIKYCLENLI